jgi:hypothetical protein
MASCSKAAIEGPPVSSLEARNSATPTATAPPASPALPPCSLLDVMMLGATGSAAEVYATGATGSCCPALLVLAVLASGLLSAALVRNVSVLRSCWRCGLMLQGADRHLQDSTAGVEVVCVIRAVCCCLLRAPNKPARVAVGW